jgi:ATP-dependent Clp protease, protease subunit
MELSLEKDTMSTSTLSEKQIYTIGNKIVFMSNINDQSASILIKQLCELEQAILEDKKTIVEPKSTKYVDIILQNKPILLELTTSGGSVISAFSIINCMNNLKVDVHTIINGCAASAGTLISLAGKKRYIYKYSYVLIHEIRSSFWGKLTTIEDQYNNTQKMMTNIIDYYKQYLKMEEKELTDILQRDRFLSPDDCLKIGLVEQILS